jgi:hypothetical protein
MRKYAQFIVLRRNGKWSIKAVDQERDFSSHLEAMQAAIGLANESGKNGKPAVVLVQIAKGRFEAIWTYGKDLYPPPRSTLPSTPEIALAGEQG